MSGAPKGSVMGPILFLIFVNDLLDNLDLRGKMFADDAKIYRRIKTAQDCCYIQDDLNKLHAWSSIWLLKFNEGKCKVMHIGKNNPQSSYCIGDSVLQETKKEKDLGLLVTSDMKITEQVASAAAVANSMLRRISAHLHMFGWGHTFSTLQSSCSSSNGICCSVLVTAAEEGYCYLRKNPEKVNKDDSQSITFVI